MVKRLLLLTILLSFLQITVGFSQITIGTVDPGPYTPGSSIAATFTMPISFCVKPGNVFELYLSDATGNFSRNNRIGTYNGFYSTFINGVIPTTVLPGSNYQLQIRSTNPASVSTNSIPFQITGTVPVKAEVTSSRTLDENTFGYCPARDNAAFTFENASTALSTVTGIIKNEITGSIAANLDFATSPTTFSAAIGYYTLLVTAKLNGSVATRAYLILNSRTNNSFGTTGGAIVCLPGGFLEFPVNLDANGIKNNYPGTTYEIDWGDSNGIKTVYTRCDLQAGFVRHEYETSSCGRPVYNTGAGPQYNVFGINIEAISPYCSGASGALATYVKVVKKPENKFIVPPDGGCVGKMVNFINTSDPGQNDANTPNCIDNDVTYNWYVDDVLIKTDQPRSANFQYSFPSAKTYRIRLESINNNGLCNGEPVTHEICIHNPPIPNFEFNGNTTPHCAPYSITAIDKSYIDNSCGTTHTYNWIVLKSGQPVLASEVSFTNGIKEPTFNFLKQGRYEITLQITSSPCTVVSTNPPQTVVIIDSSPITTLAPVVNLCNLRSYTYSETTLDPTKVQFSGTEVDASDTYTWSITTENDLPLSNTDFEFGPGSNSNTKFPTIQFKQYRTYKVSVTHKNSCGSLPKSQLITFFPSPVVKITADKNPICYSASVELSALVTNGTYSSSRWIGAGTFSSPNNSTTTIYTPTQTERDAHKAIVRFVVTTDLAEPCKEVEDVIQIDIFPNNTGTDTDQRVCTGTKLNYDPALGTSLPGSTYTWTATNSDLNAGTSFTASGSGKIEDVVVNSNPTANAVIIYRITPILNNCPGVPFTFTVTVYPKPSVSAAVTNTTICSGEQAGIILTPSFSDIKYTWTTSSTNGVTGNTPANVPTATAAINHVLINNGTIQGTVTYRISPISATGCPGDEIVVNVNVDPGITPSIAGTSGNECEVSTYKLNGNQPKSNETGTWELISGQAGVTFSDVDLHSPSAVANGLVAGESYVFKWTISAPGVCSSSSSSVTITINPPTVAGTISSADPLTVCSGNNSGTINLTGNVGSVIRWEALPAGEVIWQPIANTSTTLNYSALTSTTQYRAVVRNGSCSELKTNVITIAVTPADTPADAGMPQTICGGTTAKLDGNPVNALNGETGVWSAPPGSPIHFVDATDPKTEVQNLVAGQSYTFKWTITGPSACGPSSSTVTINILPLIQQNTINSAAILVCSGQQINIIGSPPIGGNGTYNYKWEISTDNGVTWTETGGNTQNLDFPITVSTRFRRTVTSATCSDTSPEFNITALPPIKDNVISANQAVCTDETPIRLTGTPPTGADGNFNYEWEFSIDGGTTWASTNSFQPDYQATVLTRTTQYRRIVSTITCNGDQKSISNVITITLKPDAIAKFTFTKDKSCAPFDITALNVVAENHPIENATYTWFAGSTQIGTGVTFPGYTIPNSGDNIIIKLVVTPKVGCHPAEFAWTFSTNQAVPASFTLSPTTICGPNDVAFTNTSPQGAGAIFRWKVGNTQISNNANPPPYTFQPDPTGKDTTYTVTLYSETSCGIDSAKATVLVKAKPQALFSPRVTVGCSPLTVVFTNTSPNQSGVEYFYDYGDGNNSGWVSNKNDVSHTYFATTKIETYHVKMTARSECGIDVSRIYDIVVSPKNVQAELVVSGTQKKGCAPFTVDFDNNSKGATEYLIDFKDGLGLRPLAGSPRIFQHTFTEGGDYDVMLIAKNDCSRDTTYEKIIVLAQPKPLFVADVSTGCPNLPVTFKNTTIDLDITSFVWNYGDGSTPFIGFEPPAPHIYTGNQEYYTATLTATNALGCSNTHELIIHIIQPPKAAFNISPSAKISIPDYTFNFEDKSTNNPTNWEWDFGDKSFGSKLKNPSHTYSDTGTYIVKLKVLNQQGCFDTISNKVTIIGVPGYLFVPNSFIPGDTRPELRDFHAKGSGIASWRFSIFNKWGQILWETTKLDEGRPTEGWDGTFNGQPMPQGVYYWKIDVQMINGTEWKGMTYDKSAPKRTGAIHLIR
ncbi:PKD domain-containing protein [Pedobacter sp. ok626]|uniref:PKD domain-containing protein n=1 Tax=Pedobacter sp. ok626 TaxID=1761882 RepID=UPI000890ED76|nr:PKD domain-containing protein [Pedobacter sp. ok626]SDK30302.1 PKD domain-containing protein [Pedobacter sp. ok626]